MHSINSIILTSESHINDLIAGKVFGKILEFNTQLYLVLKPFKDLSNSKMGKLSKRGVFQSLCRAVIMSFILNG